MNIIMINEMKTSGRSVIMPITPEKIEFKSNGTRFVTYNILDKGEVKKPQGSNLREVRWQSIFPGENHYLPYRIKEHVYRTPKQYQTILSEWRAYGTPLKLMITGTPIRMDVYLKDYSITYEGAFGDYGYTVDFIDNKDISVTSTLISETAVSAAAATETEQQRPVEEFSTYTTVQGDTLWTVAQKFLGDGSRSGEIYNVNVDVLKTQRPAATISSPLLPPGIVLRIPN